MRTRTLLATTAAALLPAALAAQGGPLGTYYLTAGEQHTNWRIQGGTATSSSQQHTFGTYGESAIAVAGDVRTMGLADRGVYVGSRYSLDLVYTGVDYASPNTGFFDGATDGTYNYGVHYLSGSVFRFNRDWSISGTPFAVAPFTLGITYDAFDNTLWMSSYVSKAVAGGISTIAEYRLDGTLVRSFTTDIVAITALAMDYADGTLWMGTQSEYGRFYQFSRSGTQLQTVKYVGMINQNTMGGEFNFVAGSVVSPEPATPALVVGGLLVLGAAARRRRSPA